MRNPIMEAARNSLYIELDSIKDLIGYINEELFLEAVQVLNNSNKIITIASGSSGIAAKKFSHTLCCIECSSQFLSPSEAVHGGLGCVKKGDTVVMVSRGGKTVELLPIISVVKQKEANLIVVTENENSPLAAAANLILPIKIARESDKYNIMATASFVVTIALFDALIASLMEESGYQLEQFALIHPGGAVGELLNK